MKKIITFFVTIILASGIFAQSPEKMSYQAVVRNSTDKLIVNQLIGMRVSILQGTSIGTVVYSETHKPTTNNNGLASIEIGKGTVVSGTFSGIKWSTGPYFIKTETDPAGGTTYSITATTELTSVPYALHAKTVQTGDNWGTQAVATDATLSGNGLTATPLKIAQQSATNGQILKWNGTIWSPSYDNNGPFASSAGITYNTNTSDHFVLGSPSVNDIEGTEDNIRFYFNKQKGAFRAGEAYMTNWDTENTGDYSVAMGYKTLATGRTSTALGSSTTATGWHSVSMGYGTLAGAINVIALGKYNVGLGNPNVWVPEDPIFEIGIGAAQAERQNAMTVLKNGKVGIGTSTPTEKLEVVGLVKITGGSPGSGKVLTSDATGLASWQAPSGGGVVLPYTGTGAIASDPIFTIINTGNGSGIKAKSNATTGVYYGIIGEAVSDAGYGVSGSAPFVGVYGNAYAENGTAVHAYSYASEGTNYAVRGLTNSSNGYSGFFEGGRFHISGNTGIGVTNPTAKLEVAGQVKITGGNPGAGKVLTSDTNGLASWQTFSSNSWQSSGSNIYYNNGRVGIGTTSPAALLHTIGTAIGHGNVVFAGQVKYTTPGDPPVSGEGTRMMWYPDKAAFRAGYADGTQWDKSYTGAFSTAFGHSTVASGEYSTALGYATTASGNHSLTIGEYTTASGAHAAAGGYSVSASGGFSTAIGQYITAPSYLETVFGRYNTTYAPANATSWSDPDRLFVIGNGTLTTRSNALTILKNGNTGIGTDSPSAKLEVAGQIKIIGGSPGSGKALFSDANGLATWQSIAPWLHNGTDIYLFGGKLGLGNTSPAAKLDVSTSQGPNIIIRDSDGGPGRPGIQFVNNDIHFIGADDTSTEIFGFYSQYGNNRTNAARLNIHGPASDNWGKYIGFTHDGNHGRIDTDAGYLVLQPAGNRVGVGTDAPTQSLDVNGTMRVRGMTTGASAGTVYRTSDGTLITGSSDIRLKENIEPIQNSLEKVIKLNGVTFSWKADPNQKRNIGFIAQEFEKVIPELVFTNETDGYKGINYAEVNAVLVEAIKELKAENDLLKLRLEKIETMMEYKADK